MALPDSFEGSLINQLDTYIYIVSNDCLLDFFTSDQDVFD